MVGGFPPGLFAVEHQEPCRGLTQRSSHLVQGQAHPMNFTEVVVHRCQGVYGEEIRQSGPPQSAVSGGGSSLWLPSERRHFLTNNRPNTYLLVLGTSHWPKCLHILPQAAKSWGLEAAKEAGSAGGLGRKSSR